MVVNTETLTVENTLQDKSYLGPLDFDLEGRFWFQRDYSTVEAWDDVIMKTRSRHRLKGQITGHHKTENGVECIVTFSEKEEKLRVYKLE